MKCIKIIGVNESAILKNNLAKSFSVVCLFQEENSWDVWVSSYYHGKEFFEMPIDKDDTNFHIWQADMIIRFCERNIHTDTVYIVYDTTYHIASNIAYELSLCYNTDFDLNNEPEPDDEAIRTAIRAKHTQISYSLLHVFKPMDYCKMMLEIMFRQLSDVIAGKRIEGYNAYDFFINRCCYICLNNGTILHFDTETELESIIIPNMDDIEYVQFYGVPEIADPSSFEENDNGLFYNYDYSSIGLDYYSFEIYDYYGFHFSYNSIDGLTERRSELPDKYKNYLQIR